MTIQLSDVELTSEVSDLFSFVRSVFSVFVAFVFDLCFVASVFCCLRF